MERHVPVNEGAHVALFSFADETQWSDFRLNGRMGDLVEVNNVPLSPERQSAVARELSHLIFELQMRSSVAERKAA